MTPKSAILAKCQAKNKNSLMKCISRLLGCPSPCATITFSFGIPDTQPRVKDKYQYKVYFKRYIGVTKESLKYPVESLIAEVGGYLGLLLGVSVLDCLVVPEKINHFWNSLF